MGLKEKAIEMSEIYRKNPKVEAIIFSWFSSRKLEDEHSDIELTYFMVNATRMRIVKGLLTILVEQFCHIILDEEEEWSETYLTKEGIKLEISNFLTETVEKVISDVVDQYDISYEKQCIVSSVHDGVSLYGEEKVHALKDRVVAYPENLAKRMISENLWLSNRWHNREHF